MNLNVSAETRSAALDYLSGAVKQAAQIPGLTASLPRRAIKRIGVVGAGTMGGGIAMNYISAGIPTVIIETAQEALDRGLDIVRKNYEASVAKGKLSAEDMQKRMSLLKGTLDYADLADCDLVIEAVFENMEIKKLVCARLGQVCKLGAIIASNTSTLNIDALAVASGRPADFLGMHFFSPANVMRLLEVVRGAKTAPEVLVSVMDNAKAIGKIAVVSGVCYGFIGNRMLEGYLRESEFLMLEGVPPARIDAAIQSIGMPMGPCRMIDLAGVDVAAKVVVERDKSGGLPPDPSYRVVVRKMLELGRFGQKTGAGYYRYEGRNAVPDPAVEAICADLARKYGIARRDDGGAGISDEEILERCLYPLINEGVKILDEGIAYRPGDIDAVWVYAYAFPDFRGGPMHMADTLGPATIAEGLARYARQRGNAFGYWTPAALLQRMVADGQRFADWSNNS